jgi:hypothetical protein
MAFAPERGKIIGTFENLARMVGAKNGEMDIFLAEAEEFRFCDICVTDNKIVTVCNRRMWRDDKDRRNNRLRQERFRAKQAKPKSNAKITPPSSSPSPSPKNKKKNIQKEKGTFGEFKNVKLTPEELSKLQEKFSIAGTHFRIENLSAYMESKGKSYASHYATILNWDWKDKREAEKANGNTDPRLVCKKCHNESSIIISDLCPNCRKEVEDA